MLFTASLSSSCFVGQGLSDDVTSYPNFSWTTSFFYILWFFSPLNPHGELYRSESKSGFRVSPLNPVCWDIDEERKQTLLKQRLFGFRLRFWTQWILVAVSVGSCRVCLSIIIWYMPLWFIPLPVRMLCRFLSDRRWVFRGHSSRFPGLAEQGCVQPT